jgi:hypothetical protein
MVAAVLAFGALVAGSEASVSLVLPSSSGVSGDTNASGSSPYLSFVPGTISSGGAGSPNVNVTLYNPPATATIVVDWSHTYATLVAQKGSSASGSAHGIHVSVDLFATVGQEYLITFATEEITAEIPRGGAVHAVDGQYTSIPEQMLQSAAIDNSKWVTESSDPVQAVSRHTTLTFFCEMPTNSGSSDPYESSYSYYRVSAAAVPEPATLIVWALLGAASWLGMRLARRGRRRSSR